jgi:GTP-binding protein LepA
MLYEHPADNQTYLLNLIDTPGHVDFSYQVSRSIRACEGAVLIVDATKGIQAQTISNFYQAFDAGLQIIPVINKIDLQAADVPEAEEALVDQLDFALEDILYISAKNGINLQSVFDAIIDRIPAPKISATDELLKCFLFDARFIP